ncbi:MAG: rRNA pseudouridine synthase [Clostridiales bacterium]|jgi:23S rRNA pseudouridine2605 synthase|nr:rRNA pseudouridine synthase [Clostridiales bacterium]HOA34186.1 pseudouridine synthase [Clostridiales bacterium]HOJ35456.1 pseudouridine synthase [Clostridiales bacterium]HOL79875.1 pseudouridine synthase [Clostridiales bacterium]HPP68792.1 pseudouridine synthase [Clostridiales bacterium]
MEKIRLQKFLSDCGVASRRKAEQLIIENRVRVNGVIASIGDKVDPQKDVVTVNGKRVTKPEGYKYIMLNKPRGYISTMSDEFGRKSVADLVKDVGIRVYPIGRLDKDSEGLLLFTNDGEFSNLLMHPSSHVEKTYRVTAKPALKDEDIDRLSLPFMMDGKETTPAVVTVLEQKEDRTVLEIKLKEGRNRQIRRMLEEIGAETARLKRTAIGGIKLGMLRPGKWRELMQEEVASLYKAARTKKGKE